MRQQGTTCTRSKARSLPAQCRAPRGPAALAATRTRPLQHIGHPCWPGNALAAAHLKQIHPKYRWPLCMQMKTCPGHGQQHHRVHVRPALASTVSAAGLLSKYLQTGCIRTQPQPQARTAERAAAASAPPPPQNPPGAACAATLAQRRRGGRCTALARPACERAGCGRADRATQHSVGQRARLAVLASAVLVIAGLAAATARRCNTCRHLGRPASRQARQAACTLGPRAARRAADPRRGR